MTKREIYEKAFNILDHRRQEALVAAQKRREEVIAKVPQVLSMEDTMSQSVIRLTKLVLAKSADLAEVMPKIIEENQRAQGKIKELLLAHHFPSDYLETKFHCSRCRDTGYVEGERCDCLKMLVRKIAAEDFNHSTFMSLCSFQDFDLGYYRGDDNEKMKQIYQFCRSYAASFSLQSPNILMMGNTGLGKTHLSLAIAREAIEAGYTALYGTAQDFFEKIQNERFGKGEEGVNTTATVMGADLLVLDDLGAEYDSNYNQSTFYHILNSRLNAGKPTIINTNLTPKQLETRYGARAGSRLMTLYKCLKFCGTDIRQQNLCRK